MLESTLGLTAEFGFLHTGTVSCSFCLTMMTDDIAAKKPEVKACDVAKLMMDERLTLGWFLGCANGFSPRNQLALQSFCQLRSLFSQVVFFADILGQII